MLHIIDFIKNHPLLWETLLTEDPYNLKVKRDEAFPHLISLSYDMINSDFSEPIVKEARGIIIDIEDICNPIVVCQAFNKFFNYGEEQAAEIDWSTARVQEKVDGCFTADDMVILADGTKRKIGQIVRNKESVEVLSYNFTTDKIESKKVVGWNMSKETYPLTDWLSIKLRGVKQSLDVKKLSQHCYITPTKNHMIYIKDEQDKIVEVRADTLKVGDRVLTPAEGLTSIEKQVILGTLLGDGSCTFVRKDSNKGITFQHSLKQKKYVQFKARLLSRLGGKEKESYIENAYGHEKYAFKSHTHKGISDIYNLTYDENGHKKVTKSWLSQLDWLGFAIWYMDDGSLQTGCKNNSIHLHTEGFSDEEQKIIADYYNELGYKATIQNPDKYHIINFSTEASERIWQHIRKYIIPEMQYKLPERHQGYFQDDAVVNVNDNGLELFEGVIESIEEGLIVHNPYNSMTKQRFDIEVEDNHNYFCGGILVHNSICKLWYYNKIGKWILSSNSCIQASKAELASGYNLEKLFLMAIRKYDCKTIEEFIDRFYLVPFYTYIFELVSPYNQVVIQYPEIDIYFIGARQHWENINREVDLSDNLFLREIKQPKSYSLSTLEDCIEAAKVLNTDGKVENEGFVVVDANWNRVKIKSPDYVAMHHLANGLSREDLLHVIRIGEVKEVLNYFPKYEMIIKEMARDYGSYQRNLIKQNFAARKRWKELNQDRKAFAIEYSKKNFPEVFKLLDMDWKWNDYLKGLTDKQLLKNIDRYKAN